MKDEFRVGYRYDVFVLILMDAMSVVPHEVLLCCMHITLSTITLCVRKVFQELTKARFGEITFLFNLAELKE